MVEESDEDEDDDDEEEDDNLEDDDEDEEEDDGSDDEEIKTKSKNERPDNEKNFPESAEIFVGNIPFTATADGLKEVFASFGTIDNISIPMSGKRMKGYAFIKYGTRAEAEKAVKKMHGHEYDGRELKVNFSSGQATEKPNKKKEGGDEEGEKQERPKSSTIFVGNLSYSTNE